MDKEVDPAVLAVINEKRLLGDKRTPVEIIAKMGVFDARTIPAPRDVWDAGCDAMDVPDLRPYQPASTYFTKSGHGRYLLSESPS